MEVIECEKEGVGVMWGGWVCEGVALCCEFDE